MTNPSHRSLPASWRRPWLVLTVSCLLALHWLLAFQGVLGRSVTSDETAHLTAGLSYWQFNDYRLQPENGLIPQRWGALPLYLMGARLAPTQQTEAWATSDVWTISQYYLFGSGQNTDFNLLVARSFMLFWSLAAGLLVFFVARSLWGDTSGIGALAFFALSPTTLAHGPLITSDMCAAFFLIATTLVMGRAFTSPRSSTVIGAGILLGLALTAKFSAVLLIPTGAVILIGTILVSSNKSIHYKTTPLKLLMPPLIVAIIATGAVWLLYGFNFNIKSPAGPYFSSTYLPWQRILPQTGYIASCIGWARDWHLLPEAFIYGFTFVVYFSAERGAFLAGHYSTTGWWWFFPFAFLVKSTLGELFITILIIAKITRLILGKALNFKRIISSPLFHLGAFSIVFGLFSAMSHLNIGQRHILPLYLVLFILSGALWSASSPRWLLLCGTLALILSTTETLYNRPNHLAFFNQAAGGSENGWRLLVDSSLDWGQDVQPLAEWIAKNRLPNEPVYTSTFGTADPTYEGIPGDLLSPYYSLAKERRWYEFKPGLYCISATMLQDVYGIKPGPWNINLERDYQNYNSFCMESLRHKNTSIILPSYGFHPEHPLWLLDRLRFARLCQYLKIRKPDAIINHTQFIFRLNTEEINIITKRPFSELVKLMESSTHPIH